MQTRSSRSRIRATSRAAVVGALLLSPLAMTACGGDDQAKDTKEPTSSTTAKPAAKLEATGAWARAAKAEANSAVYLKITGGAESDALLGATVPADVADKVEMHETVAATSTTTAGGMGSETTAPAMGSPTTVHADSGSTPTSTGGMMTMQPVEKIPVPADGSVELKPGGLHVMLFGLKKDLAVGMTVPVTLTFEKAGQIQVTAEVREL
ncbi:MAG: copper chaperone PCu(A)C [Actinobacteria bacterium]|nr:copper chaperone PCu(A)C [Actinomycetota bacterium]